MPFKKIDRTCKIFAFGRIVPVDIRAAGGDNDVRESERAKICFRDKTSKDIASADEVYIHEIIITWRALSIGYLLY